MRDTWWAAILALFITLFAITPARAGTVTPYLENYAGWEAATTQIKTIDFELGRPLKYGTYEMFSSVAGLNLQATGALAGETVNFNGLYTDGSGNTKYNMYVVNPLPGESSYWGSGMELKGPAYRPGQEARIRVTLPAGGAQSVGVDLRSADNAGQSFKIILYGDAGYTTLYTATPVSTQVPGPGNIHSFWGATSDVAITRMDIILLGDIADTTMPVIDNFRYGTVGAAPDPMEPTPEPPTGAIYLTIAGLALLASRRLKFLAH